MTKVLVGFLVALCGVAGFSKEIKDVGVDVLDYEITGISIRSGKAFISVEPTEHSNVNAVKAMLGNSKPWIKLPDDQALLQAVNLSFQVGLGNTAFLPVTMSVNHEGRITHVVTGNGSLED